MKFTLIAVTLALAGAVAAHPHPQDEVHNNVARSLIEEAEQFLNARADGCVARNPSKYAGMKCNVYACQKHCVPGPSKCRWAERPDECSKCKCQKGTV
jgi:hypothetical protein